MHPVFPNVKIDQFEGPYDLLVELAKKQKVDISIISLQKLTEPFLIYIKENIISPEIVASFIVVASTLLLIKARQILPNIKPEEEEEEISNLEERLAIYKQYRKTAEQLGILWGRSPLLPARFFSEGEKRVEQDFSSFPNILPEALAEALRTRVKAIPIPQPKAHLTYRGKTLSDILAIFKHRLTESRKLIFQETIQGADRQEQAVSFLAILEMARKQEVTLEQSEAFGTLVVHKV